MEMIFFGRNLLTIQMLGWIYWRPDKPGQKNAGLAIAASRHSQPRLPGSVVGEASMDWSRRADKITKDNDL